MTEKSNGVRIPLLVDGVVLLVGITTATMMWSDVQQLKAEQVPEARVVAIEQQLKYMHEAIQELKRQQREDTKRVIEAITQQRRDRQ